MRRLSDFMSLAALGFSLALAGFAHAASPHHEAARANAIDWPQFRFDDRHTGANPKEGKLNRKNIKFAGLSWQAQLGGLVDFSSPAVVGGVVYIGTFDGYLFAYPADGCGSDFCDAPLWKSTYLAQIVDSPTVANGLVYVGSQTSYNSNNGKLDVFSAGGCGQAQCAPLWRGDAGKDSVLSSSPAVWNGFVFVGTFGQTLYAFAAAGCGKKLCQPIWTATTGGSIESTATVYKGVLFIGSDDGKLYAFKAKGCGKPSCKPIWTGALGSAVFESSPAISKGVVYIGSQHALSAFDANGCGAKVCKPLWQAIDNEEFFNGSPAVGNGRVYIGLESGIAAYGADGCGQSVCDKLWAMFGSGAQAAVLSSPTLANGVVYAGRNTAEVLAWDANGCGKSFCTELWKGRTDDEIVSSSPSVVNGKIYIGSNNKSYPEDISGRLYVYEVQKRR